MTTMQEYLEIQAMNGSTLAHGLTSMRQLRHVIDNGPVIPADTTRVGTALHSIVEFLPRDRFDDYFVVMPDFANDADNCTDKGKPSNSPLTNYVKDRKADFLIGEDREVISKTEYERITRMLQAISNNDRAMRLIVNSDREINAVGNLFGTDCKGRIDGIACDVAGERMQWNLKTSNRIDKRSFCNLAARLHYPLKDALHRMLLRSTRKPVDLFAYIVVLDSRPVDGQFRDAADCVVVDVPDIVLDNQEPVIESLIAKYQRCLVTDVWPGIHSYTFEPPIWSMADEMFEDKLV